MWFPLNSAGRIIVRTTAPAIDFILQGLPVTAAGEVAAATVDGVGVFAGWISNGLLFTTTGLLAVSTNAPDRINNGLPVDSLGNLSLVALDPVNVQSGVPFAGGQISAQII